MDIVEKMAGQFDEDKLALKLVEECMELCEVLVKRVTKSTELKPPLEKVIEEMGDVMFRFEILGHKLGILDEVDERACEKAEQIDKWFTEKFETKIEN